MSDYTPGPWAVISGEVCAAGYGPIAHCDRENRNTKPVERDANARLISAAPELLEALEAVMQFPLNHKANLAAHAAIAKAKGVRK